MYMASVFDLPDVFQLSAPSDPVQPSNGGGGNGGASWVRGIELPFGAPQKRLHYVTISGLDETVGGLDRHTCWVRWCQNRDAIERGRGYAIHDITDAQIAAAKLYHNGLRIREREMNGPPRPSKPKLTILVDQDIED